MNEPARVERPGYHLREIPRGVLGETSKIREELEELEDAEAQGVRLMAMVEMADLYGALQARAAKYGLTMHDLATMDVVTARAFENGRRR